VASSQTNPLYISANNVLFFYLNIVSVCFVFADVVVTRTLEERNGNKDKIIISLKAELKSLKEQLNTETENYPDISSMLEFYYDESKQKELENEKMKENVKDKTSTIVQLKKQLAVVNEELNSEKLRSSKFEGQLAILSEEVKLEKLKSSQLEQQKQDLANFQLAKYQELEKYEEKYTHLVDILKKEQNQLVRENEKLSKLLLNKDTEGFRLNENILDLSSKLKSKDECLKKIQLAEKQLALEKVQLVKDNNTLCKLLLDKGKENVELKQTIADLDYKLKTDKYEQKMLFCEEKRVLSEEKETIEKLLHEKENENACLKEMMKTKELNTNNEKANLEILLSKEKRLLSEEKETLVKVLAENVKLKEMIRTNELNNNNEINKEKRSLTEEKETLGKVQAENVKLKEMRTSPKTPKDADLTNEVASLEIVLCEERVKRETLEDEVTNLKNECQTFEPWLADLHFSFYQKEEKLKKDLETKEHVLNLIEEVLIVWRKPTEEKLKFLTNIFIKEEAMEEAD